MPARHAHSGPRRMPPDWLPDWRDSSAYPAASAPLCQWAWQFLRRNPEYQADWESFVRPHYDPVDRSIDGRSVVPFHTLREKYGVHYPADPALRDTDPMFEAAYILRTIEGSIRLLPGQVWRLREHEVGIILDKRLPRGPQIRAADAYFEEMQRTFDGDVIEVRYHRDKWPNYLRILDAKAAGEKHDVIAAGLFPQLSNAYDDGYKGRKQVQNQLKAAQRLRDVDYRYIPLGIYK
jgi:hypothetical protein